MTINPAFRQKPRRFAPSIADAEAAITRNRGFLTPASRDLGVARSVLDRMVTRSSKLAFACRQANESLLDFAESKLYENIARNDTKAIVFCLSTKGKHRGYALAKGTEIMIDAAPRHTTLQLEILPPTGRSFDYATGQIIEHQVIENGPQPVAGAGEDETDEEDLRTEDDL
jgi:hypothetical protein